MRRRDFITLLSGAATWPLAAHTQPSEHVRHIGVISGLGWDDPVGQAMAAAFVRQLQDLGWIEGRNLQIDYRYAARVADRPQAVKDLVRLEPDVIVASGTPTTQALQMETSTIPIIFGGASDPLASGLVKSLSHPGGNVTGFTNYEFSVGGKWLELLKQAAPTTERVLVLTSPDNDGNLGLWRAIGAAAPALSVTVSTVDRNVATEVEREIEALARAPNGGLIALPGTRGAIVNLVLTLAARHRLPAIYPQRAFARAGGLMAYGFDATELWRNAAVYADRILKGEKAGDLPVQQPTKFDLVINLKTARALGLTVPLNLLVAADEVIE